MKREATCCFSGHRVLSAAEKASLPGLIEAAVREFSARGYRDFIAGGALGFDMLAAETVLALREEGLPVRLILALPCEGQDEKWRSGEKRRYAALLSRADETHLLGGRYAPGCMQARNDWMVDHSSALICYCRRAYGGTAYTLSAAYDAGITLKNLAQIEKKE